MTAPMTSQPRFAAMAAAATGRAVRSPALLGILLAAHYLVAGLSWLWTAQILGPGLRGQPGPELFSWVAMIQAEPALLGSLLTAAGCGLALYWVVGAVAAAVAYGRFAEVSDGRALRRPFGRILLLRGLILLLSAAMLAGLWFTVAPLSPRFHELDNELLIMGLHLLVALPFLTPLLVLLCVAHYAQAILVRREQGVLAALAAGLKLVHASPLAAGGLWVTGWLAWILVSAALTLPGLEAAAWAQVAVVSRVAIHLWMVAAGWEVAKLSTVDCGLSTTST